MNLLERISDPLEALTNLAYLIEARAGNDAQVQEYGRLMAQELDRVLVATHQCLEDVYQPVGGTAVHPSA